MIVHPAMTNGSEDVPDPPTTPLAGVKFPFPSMRIVPRAKVMEPAPAELGAIGNASIERRSTVTASAHRSDRTQSMDSQENIFTRLYRPSLWRTATPPPQMEEPPGRQVIARI